VIGQLHASFALTPKKNDFRTHLLLLVYADDINILSGSVLTIKNNIDALEAASKEIGKGKGKAVPLQAWAGAEGSRRLKLADFKTIGTLRW
jgi:hypothetical protein